MFGYLYRHENKELKETTIPVYTVVCAVDKCTRHPKINYYEKEMLTLRISDNSKKIINFNFYTRFQIFTSQRRMKSIQIKPVKCVLNSVNDKLLCSNRINELYDVANVPTD